MKMGDTLPSVVVGELVSIPNPILRDVVEVTAVFPEWFEWSSLTRDAKGGYPFKMLAQCFSVCEHMNDERICIECDGEE